jgi:hypothetical protein
MNWLFHPNSFLRLSLSLEIQQNLIAKVIFYEDNRNRLFLFPKIWEFNSK